MTEMINNVAEKWFTWQWGMLWQVNVLIAIVWAIDLVMRRWAWPQVRYAMWLLVLVKLVLPVSLTSPASFTAEIPFWAERTVKVEINRIQDAESGIQNVESSGIGQNTGTTDGIERSAYSVQRSETGAVELSWKGYGFIVWVCGAVVLAGWLTARLHNLRRVHLKDGEVNQPERFKELVAEAAKRLKLKRKPVVILTDKVKCPAVFGVFKPVLLIPAEKSANLTRADAEHIFLHELAHIKRGDLFVHAVYMCLQVVYWFNPLLWLVRGRMQNLRELCCDATVARLLREKIAAYRETLLETARQLLAERTDVGMGLLGLFENSSRLIDRLKWLEKKTWRMRPLRVVTVFVMVCVMAACVLPMARAENGLTAEGTKNVNKNQSNAAERRSNEVSKKVVVCGLDRDDSIGTPDPNKEQTAFEGIVVDETGKPIEGVLVDAWTWYPGNETTTDANGHFKLGGFKDDKRIEVRFSKEKYSPFLIVRQQLGVRDAVIVMNNRTYFEGKVLDVNGRPATNALIRAAQGPKMADGVVINEIWTETHTDQNGDYRLYIQPDTYDIRVNAPGVGLVVVARILKMAIEPNQARTLDITLKPAFTFRAKVIDSITGKPAAGVRLFNLRTKDVEGRSDANGLVVIPGMLPGRFEFWVESKDYTRWWSQAQDSLSPAPVHSRLWQATA